MTFPKTETDNNYEKFEEIIEKYNLNGEKVLQLFTDYHGLQLMSNEFIDFVADEGYEF